MNDPTAIAARGPQRPPIRAPSQPLVNASVSLDGRAFTTMIREGATTEELVQKVAKENGGGVARVFYPEFNTWEIVAVKIGGTLLVKGDPKRVADADFSDFADPEGMRSAAVSASRGAKGGIHFSIGESGIPIAVTQDLGVVFPNAAELRVGNGTRNIALWTTEVNADPVTLADLNRQYSNKGGISVSEDAFANLAKAHGGTRSGTLVLEDNLLVLDKDTGDIMTAAQYSLPKDIELAPQSRYVSTPISPPVPAMGRPPALLGGDHAARNRMFDASTPRMPCTIARVFDGSVFDLLSIRYRPLRDEAPPPAPQSRIAPGSQRASSPPALRFALLRFAEERKDAPGTRPLPPGVTVTAPNAEPATESKIIPDTPRLQKPKLLDAGARSAPPISPEEILRSWSGTRKERLELPVPASCERLDTNRPRNAALRDKPAQMPVAVAGQEKKEKRKKKRRSRPEEKPARQSPEPRRQRAPEQKTITLIKKPRKARALPIPVGKGEKKSLARQKIRREKPASKSGESKRSRARQARTLEVVSKPKARTKTPKATILRHSPGRPAARSRATSEKRKTGEHAKKGKRRSAALTLIGMFRRKRKVSGRASAGSSG